MYVYGKSLEKNCIRGGNCSLMYRKFKTFLNELEAKYGDLLLRFGDFSVKDISGRELRGQIFFRK